MNSEKQDSSVKVNGIPLHYDLCGEMTTEFKLDKTTGWITAGTIRQSLKGTLKFLDSPQVPGDMDVPSSVLTEMRLSNP